MKSRKFNPEAQEIPIRPLTLNVVNGADYSSSDNSAAPIHPGSASLRYAASKSMAA